MAEKVKVVNFNIVFDDRYSDCAVWYGMSRRRMVWFIRKGVAYVTRSSEFNFGQAQQLLVYREVMQHIRREYGDVTFHGIGSSR